MSGRPGLVVSAPGRAGIIGNPSDIYGGSVVSCAVPRRATCRVSPYAEAPRGLGVLLELGGVTCAVSDETDLVLRGDSFDLARAVLTDVGLPSRSCRVALATTIPYCAGLSGSTALMVATTAALLAWRDGRLPPPYALAERVRRTEYDILGVTCGFQDAYMTVFGGLRYCDFRGKTFAAAGTHLGTAEPLVEHAPSPPLVIAHTDVRRDSGSVHRPLTQRWLEGDGVVIAAYERVALLGRWGKQALLAGDWPALGELMNENHALQRDLGGSGPENEALIGAALVEGAWGAKLAGAGRGGTIIALHPDPPRLIAALRRRGVGEIFCPDPAAPGMTLHDGEAALAGVLGAGHA